MIVSIVREVPPLVPEPPDDPGTAWPLGTPPPAPPVPPAPFVPVAPVIVFELTRWTVDPPFHPVPVLIAGIVLLLELAVARLNIIAFIASAGRLATLYKFTFVFAVLKVITFDVLNNNIFYLLTYRHIINVRTI